MGGREQEVGEISSSVSFDDGRTNKKSSLVSISLFVEIVFQEGRFERFLFLLCLQMMWKKKKRYFRVLFFEV